MLHQMKIEHTCNLSNEISFFKHYTTSECSNVDDYVYREKLANKQLVYVAFNVGNGGAPYIPVLFSF